MRLLTSLAVVTVTALTVSGCTLAGKPAEPSATPVAETMTETPSVEPMSSPEMSPQMAYTLDEVAKHSTKDDCWMSIEGKVYDVTPVTSSGKHPGGPVILQGCGTDATKLFMDRPGDKGPHSDQTISNLENFYVGELEQ